MSKKTYQELIADDNDSIRYRPKFAKELTVTSAILLQQINYWWQKQGQQPFYKFKQPCSHRLYDEGDSWAEELGFSRKEFDTAFNKIGAKITKSQWLSEDDLPDVYVWAYTDMDRTTFWILNEVKFNNFIHGLYVKPESDFRKSDKVTLSVKPESDFRSIKQRLPETTNRKPLSDKSDDTPKIEKAIFSHFKQTPFLSESWLDWLAWRRRCGKPMTKLTERGLKGWFADLKNLSGGDSNVAAKILDQSSKQGYQGIFELKEGKNKQRGANEEPQPGYYRKLTAPASY